MRPLLPELIFVRFVRSPVMPKLIEQPFAPFELDLLDELFSGEALQIAQDGGEIGRGEDGVEMIVEDDPGMDGQPFVLAAVFERSHDDVAARRGSEDGQPFDGGGGDEVSAVRLASMVAAAHPPSVAKQSFGDKRVPKLELGNELETSESSCETPTALFIVQPFGI